MENLHYKYDDYSLRSNDPYAGAKYQIGMRWLPQKPNLRVLNAGCGSGEMTAALARRTDWHIDAIDTDPEAIQLSQALKESQNLTNVTVTLTSIEAFADRDFDIIVSNDVLEHVKDDGRVIQQFAAMLKPDSVLFISVPALPWLFGYHDEMLGHYRRYNEKLLTERLSDYFVVHRWRYFGATLIPAAYLYSRLLRIPYPLKALSKPSLLSQTVKHILNLEQRLPLPLGISLLALATPRLHR